MASKTWAYLCLFICLNTGVFAAEEKPADPPTPATTPEKEAEKAAFQQAIELQLKSSKEAEQPEDLVKHIAKGIELLEAKKYADFLTLFVHPEEFKTVIAKRGSLEEFAKHFGEARAESMLARLKFVQGKKAWMTADNLTAVFDLKASNIKDAKAYLPFVKLDGKWVIKNK